MVDQRVSRPTLGKIPVQLNTGNNLEPRLY
jgi:hypothetical protein